MKIDWLKPLLGHTGPFATVHLDATPSDTAGGDRDVAHRWRVARKDLAARGASAVVLDLVDEAIARPTWASGPHGRVLVADETGVLVDRVLHSPPTSTTASWSRIPDLLQTIRAADESVELLLVTIDRQGADFLRAGPDGRSRDAYTAPHDEIVKSSSSSTKQARIESRAEDSQERNATAIAGEVTRRVGGTQPELVILTGDARMVARVRESLRRPIEVACVEVPGGVRGGGGDAFADRVAAELENHRERRREHVLADLRQSLGRDSGAVSSMDDVVTVLARGQVAELVLAEDFANGHAPVNGRTLWIGPEPVHIAPTRTDLEALGVREGIEELPAAVAVVRSAIGQDAGLTFAPEGSIGVVPGGVPEGVAAILRWQDGDTPHELAAAMSGDDVRLRGAPGS